MKKAVLMLLMIILSVSMCQAEEWDWEKKDNPEWVAYAERHDWSYRSWGNGYNVTKETTRKEGLMLRTWEKGLKIHDSYLTIKTEILAWRKENYWGRVTPYIYFVKLKKENGEITHGYLDEIFYIKTRRKIMENDVGGYIQNKSINVYYQEKTNLKWWQKFQRRRK